MTTAINDTSKRTTWQMFDRIAGRYDLLNRMLSAGIDVYWRKQLIPFIPNGDSLKLLDLATGTGDVALTLQEALPDRFSHLMGMDLSAEMMKVGQEKTKKRGLDSLITFQQGDATQIPLLDNSFDVVTIAFGIRNVSDVPKALSEMRRVLKRGGRAMILEFSLPKNWALRSLYLTYFRHVLPRVGGLLSGDKKAYHYLNQSVEAFPYGTTFCQLMDAVGFHNITMKSLTGGIATLYMGDK